MTVINNGQAGVDLDLSAGVTKLGFEVAGVGNVTGEYQVQQPVGLEGGGGTLLAGNSQGILKFVVTQTGTTQGIATITGRVEGVDVNSSQTVWDDTFDGGSGNVTVQSPGNLQIIAITNRAAVTKGQSTDWPAVVHVRNQGQASVSLTFDAVYPAIRTDPDTAIVWVRPSTLFGGGTNLAGGMEDSLVFTADSTGLASGNYRLDAAVSGIENNSGDSIDYDTGVSGSGFGSVMIQEPPTVVINAITAISPNAPNVNTGQQFKLAAQIKNTGQAAASDIKYELISSSGSIILPPQQRTLALLGGGNSAIDTFVVQADANTGADTLALSVTRATDVNSGDTALAVIGPHVQDRAVVIKEMPAALSINEVTPSKASVTRQQTTPWYVTVELMNGGGADLNVNPPSPSDIAFYLGAVKLTGYTVNAPDTFLSGRHTWRLSGGESDSLRYTVAKTGDDVGTVRIEVSLSGYDLNDNGNRNAVNDSSIVVQSQAGLLITDASAVAPNTPQNDLAIVNTGQSFSIDVSVGNTGEAVDSVRVTLSSNGSSSIPAHESDYRAIAKDASTVFNFQVVAASQPSIQEIFTAVITYAISVNSGQRVYPQQPIDNTEQVIIQSPADLSLNAWISDPMRTLDDTLSTEQSFSVSASVQNLGTASVDSTGRVAITLPAGFQFDSPSPPTDTVFAVGVPTVWRVKAPQSTASHVPIALRISRLPMDKNAGDSTLVSVRRDTVFVDVLEKAGFPFSSISITAPTGAMDNVLSTEQEFTLRGTVTAEQTAKDVKAALVLAPGSGFSVSPGGSVVDLGHGDGSAKNADFIVKAPAVQASEDLVIRFSAVDENSGDSVIALDTLAVSVILKSLLTLRAEIVSPEEARDSTVTPGMPFRIEAFVENGSGRADVDTSSSSPRLLIKDFGAYTVSSPLLQAFTVGEAVDWDLVAPQSPTGPVAIKVRIENLPFDENSGEPASVSGASEIVIPVQMEAAVVEIENVTEAFGFDTVTKPVSRGRKDVGLLSIKFRNPGSNDNTVRVEWMDFTVLNEDNQPVADPSAVFSELYLRTTSGRRYDGSLSTNPVRVDFGSDLVLTPAAFDTLAVYASISNNAPQGKFSVAVMSTNDISVVDTLSGTSMDIVDKITQQGDISGRYRSRGLVIISSNFADYVRNYPNPFRAGRENTRIIYFLNSAGSVSIKIYALTGKLVYEETHSSGPKTQPGDQYIEWNGRNMNGDIVRNGIYVCAITAGGNSARIKIAVAK
jgi:hypothetical protein